MDKPSIERRLEVLIDAVQYAVNRLDTDKNQPQVAGDLAVALAFARHGGAEPSIEGGGTPRCDALDRNKFDSNDLRAWRGLARQLEHMVFVPTHRHADGGLYRFVADAKYKTLVNLPWSDAVIYEADDRKLYVTTPARWNDRFVALSTYRART